MRNKNLQIGAGAAAVAVLAGIGVLVWALAFRDSGNEAAKQTSGLSKPTVSTQTLAFAGFKGNNNISQSGVSGISQVNASPGVSFQTMVGDVFAFGANLARRGPSFSYPLGSTPNASIPSEGGITQAATAATVPLAWIASAGDIMAASQSLGNGQSFSYHLVAPNTSGGGITQANTAPTVPLDQIASVASSMFSDATVGPQGSFSYPITGANTAVPSGGGISQLQTSPMQSFDSLGSSGDLMFTNASVGPQGSFSYPITGANATVDGGNGISQLQTAPMQSFSSLGSVGELMLSQATFESQSFTPSGAAPAPSTTFKLGAAARTLQATNAARVGVVFCGALVNHRCQPAYRTSMPHTQKQLLVGFVWSGLPAGTKVSLAFYDVGARKVVARPTPPYSLPASSGGTILVRFTGPFPVFKFGVGALINGKPLKGVWVLSIV